MLLILCHVILSRLHRGFLRKTCAMEVVRRLHKALSIILPEVEDVPRSAQPTKLYQKEVSP
jgi:hypothetical protein